MSRAERRRRKARKAAKVKRWTRQQAPWLTEQDVVRRVENTLGGQDVRFGEHPSERRGAQSEREQVAEVKLG